MANPFINKAPNRLGHRPAKPATGEPRVVDMSGMEYLFPQLLPCECRDPGHEEGCGTGPAWVVTLDIPSEQSIGVELQALCHACLWTARELYGAARIKQATPIRTGQ